ncbi:hypothetical protein ABK040_016204 [Willaertia magna]
MMRNILEKLIKRKTRLEELNEKYQDIMKRGVNAATAQSRFHRSYGLEDEDIITGKQHVLHNQRKNRLVFKPDREILENSTYPAEYPSTHVPILEPEVPTQRGRKVLAQLYLHFKEFYSRHRNVVWFNYTNPEKANSAWIAPSATVIGDVTLGENSSVWYNAVLRGDKNQIVIFSYTNIQDGVVITTDDKPLPGGFNSSVSIGSYCTIGHGARLHACTIGESVVIGMNATILEGAIVEDGAVIAAGALVPPGTRVPHGEMWAGSPARCVKKLGKRELEQVQTAAENYAELAESHSLEFTSNTEAYKEVDELVKKAEGYLGPETESYPVHWNVWHEMNKNPTVALWKKDRIF